MQEGSADVKLAVLEEKLLNMTDVVAKLDDTIEKISDLNVNVSKMLAVHDAKIDSVKEDAAEQQMGLSAELSGLTLEDKLDTMLFDSQFFDP